MLLKVANYNNQQKWWMFDNITKISVSEPFNRSGLEGVEYDVTIFDMPQKCSCSGPPHENLHDGNVCNNCVQYTVAVCKRSDDSEITIAFDTMAYLLNDNGKTIEKIVSNYNTDGVVDNNG